MLPPSSMHREIYMRFLVVMNMPAYNGNLVHQMHVEHKASNSLEDFVEALLNNDFVIVEEFYRERPDTEHYSAGYVAINHRYVGKVKIFNKQENGERHHAPQRNAPYRRQNY